MKIITIATQKGGVAKTTTSQELCSMLGQKYRVLGIDLDGQRHLGKFSGATLDVTSDGGNTSEVKNANDVFMGDTFILDAVQHISQPKFLNKVAVAKKVAERRTLLADEKKQIKIEAKTKAEANKLCKAADAKAKLEIAEMKKEVLEVEQQHPGYDVLPASQKFCNASKIYSDVEDLVILETCLEEIKDKYDYVIIDSAPARSPLMNMSIKASDYVIIPSERDEGSKDGITQFVIDLSRFKKMGLSHAEILGIFLVRQEKQTIQTYIEEEIKETANYLDIPVFNCTTKNSPIPKEARIANESIGEYKPNCPIAYEYYDFMNEVLEKIEERESENK